MLIFTSDLDNTLIYSHKKISDENICVEMKEKLELSYMTTRSYEKLQELKKKTLFIPVTTRSLEQYNRIRLFKGEQSKYALVSNGGILLENGKVDIEWLNKTKIMIQDCKKEMEQAYQYLYRDSERIFDIRNIDDLFLFTKSKNIEKTASELRSFLDLDKVLVTENYNKIYVLPKVLSKGKAIRRLKEKFTEGEIIAAGDSSFDLSMLKEADIKICLKEKLFLEDIGQEKNTYFWGGDKISFSEYVLECVEKHINFHY